MTGGRIAAILASQPAAPCVAHRCHFVARCAVSEFACSAFRHFVASGKVTAPTPETLAPFDFQMDIERHATGGSEKP